MRSEVRICGDERDGRLGSPDFSEMPWPLPPLRTADVKQIYFFHPPTPTPTFRSGDILGPLSESLLRAPDVNNHTWLRYERQKFCYKLLAGIARQKYEREIRRVQWQWRGARSDSKSRDSATDVPMLMSCNVLLTHEAMLQVNNARRQRRRFEYRPVTADLVSSRWTRNEILLLTKKPYF